jgi:predicted Rossmann fold nucleotide-binding protein DprA/Smf involved in DNA uptake
MRKIAIIGSREKSFKSPRVARIMITEKIEELLRRKKVEIVSGASPAGGVDIWVREFVAGLYPLKEFQPKPPLPQGFHIRNQQIVDYADEVWAFWAGNVIRSGTLSVVRKALKAGKSVRLYRVHTSGTISDIGVKRVKLEGNKWLRL